MTTIYDLITAHLTITTRRSNQLHSAPERGRRHAMKSPHIKEVRGKGLWIGVQLAPEAGGARRFCEALQGQGLLCKETHIDTIRFAPPLVITREEIDWALERIANVLV